MTVIDQTFAELQASGRKALIPFITAGDPSLEFTGAMLKALDAAGASICELGVPYSDPLADGPVIQASYTRALDAGVTVPAIMKTAKQAAGEVTAPLVAMLSYAIIYRIGAEAFVRQSRDAGFDGLIVPDLPIEEASELAGLTKANELSLIQLVTPTTPRDRARAIAETAQGFIYYVSVTGITGERESLPSEIAESLEWLRGETDTPICVGFGINRPEQIRRLAPMVDGVIVGSAIVRRIADGFIAGASAASHDQIASEVGAYVRELAEALGE